MDDTAIDDTDVIGPTDGPHRWRDEVLENHENSLIFADENTVHQPTTGPRPAGTDAERVLGVVLSPPLPFGSVSNANAPFRFGLDSPTQADRTPVPANAAASTQTPSQTDHKDGSGTLNGEKTRFARQNGTKSLSDGDTPFLRHLPDPYDDTGNDTSGNVTFLSQSPLKGRVQRKKPSRFPQIREDFELSSADTQILPKDHLWASEGSPERALEPEPQEMVEKDTQVIGSWPGVLQYGAYGDTQVIAKHTQESANDTHVLSGTPQRASDTQIIPKLKHDVLNDTQVIAKHTPDSNDTSVIPKNTLDDINDTQVIAKNPDGRFNDTQVIPNYASSTLNDTLLIPKYPDGNLNDTQVIPKYTANIVNDTQVIPKYPLETMSHTQVIAKNTPESINDTHVIAKYTQDSLNDTQVISKNTQNTNDSQDFKNTQPHSPENLGGHNEPHVIIKNTQESDIQDTEKNGDIYRRYEATESGESGSIHLNHEPVAWENDAQHNGGPDDFKNDPQLIDYGDQDISQDDLVVSDPENSPKTTTQVVNTQEGAADDTVEAVDLGRKPIYSSSQRIEGEMEIDLEIIETDDERDGSISGYDDSVSARQIQNKRKLVFDDEYPRKNTKFGVKEAVFTTSDTPLSEALLQIPRPPLPSSPTNVLASSSSLSDLSLSIREVQLVSRSQHGEIFEFSQTAEKPRTQPTDEEGDESVVYTRPRRTQSNFVVQSQQSSKEFNAPELAGEEMDLFEETSAELNESNILHPESVWAFDQFKMYTGKVLRQVDLENVAVLFEEGESNVKNTDLHFLDIRIGDRVKIRNQSFEYTVVELKTAGVSGPIRCIRGFQTAVLKRTKGKNTQEVPLSMCYMELSDWVVHQQTYRLVFKGVNLLKSHISVVSSVLFPEETGSSTPEAPEVLRKESIRVSPRKQTLEYHEKVFSGMLFCMTSIDGDDKSRVSSLITENGGVVIEEGPSLQTEYVVSEKTGCLELFLDTLDEYTFGAVIASTFCRSAKYFEGLALGWPILSETFIRDCVEDHSMVQKWPVYVLPAGQSRYLNTVKSLDVHLFRVQYERKLALDSQLANNAGLLAKYHIVALSSKQNVRTLDTCEFIFHAFGAGSLKVVAGLDAALGILESYGNDKVLLYDNSEDAVKRFRKERKKAQIQRASAYENGEPKGHRNGSSERPEDTNHSKEVSKGSLYGQLQAARSPSVGIIDWEWVVQCVISGHIWPPKTVQLH